LAARVKLPMPAPSLVENTSQGSLPDVTRNCKLVSEAMGRWRKALFGVSDDDEAGIDRFSF